MRRCVGSVLCSLISPCDVGCEASGLLACAKKNRRQPPSKGGTPYSSGYKLGPLTKFYKWLHKGSHDVDDHPEVPNVTSTVGTCKLYGLVRLGVY
jgi:hypothetical protein